MKNLKSLFLVTSLVALSSCTLLENLSHKPKEISSLNGAPKFEIKDFYKGDIEVFAITQDLTGKIIGSYTAKMNGRWEGDKGVLQQDFTFENGKKDSRTWLITADSNNGRFDAIGHDVVAPVSGKISGNSMQMVYSLSLPQNGIKENIDYEDNLFLVDNNSAIVISDIRKKKTPFGKSFISYKKIIKTTE